jgi:protein Mpv17
MSGVAQLGRTLMSPFINSAQWYNRTAQQSPFLTGIITSGLKTSAADIFAQKVIERKKEIDWTRHAVFCTFGFAYLGAFQYYLYNVKFTQWCGGLTARFGHIATAPIKVFIDQALHHPFMYFPVFYSMKAVVSGKPLSSAVTKYKSEIWESVQALWKVWVPAQIINFAFVPRHLRVPYVAAVSFGWTMILSVMQSKFDGNIAASGAAASTGNGAAQVAPKTLTVSPAFQSVSALPGSPLVVNAVAQQNVVQGSTYLRSAAAPGQTSQYLKT